MNQTDRNNFQRYHKALMQHLEELRPILNTHDLDDQAINTARDLVRKFVLSQTSIEANGAIYLCQSIAKTGEPNLETCNADYGALGQQFRDGRFNELVASQGFDFICDLLFLLLDFARRESMARERAEAARELCDRASDFVELLTGKPWEQAKPCRGVTLINAAAILTDGDLAAARKVVKGWHNSRNPKLPSPVGTLATDSRENIYDPVELAQFIRVVEGSKWGLEQDVHLSAKVVEGQPIKVRGKTNRLQSSAKSLPVKSARAKKSRHS